MASNDSLIYPSHLNNGASFQYDENEANYFMSFQAKYILNTDLVKTFKKAGLNLNVKASAKLKKISPKVILPIPENITEQLSHNWNLTKGLGAQLLETAANSVLGLAGSKLGNVMSSVSSTAQIAIDPNFKYVYQGSNPRTFSYSVTMVPKNKAEAEQINNIVKYFKVYSSPIKITPDSGASFNPKSAMGKGYNAAKGALKSFGIEPHPGAISNYIWNISFQSPIMNELTKFNKREFALLSVDVNYTGSGAAMFYKDGNPKQVNLALTFAEMKVMYSSDWA